jgi:hypothetical protein
MSKERQAMSGSDQATITLRSQARDAAPGRICEGGMLPVAEIDRQLRLMRRRLAWLTVAVFGMALAMLMTVAAVFGAVIDFHYGEGILIGGACAGGVAMGFVFGWLARRAG